MPGAAAEDVQISRFNLDLPKLLGSDEVDLRDPNAKEINNLAKLVQQTLTSRGRGR